MQIFTLFTICNILINFILIVYSNQFKQRHTKSFIITNIAAVLVETAYVGSLYIAHDCGKQYSMVSSLYFIGVDIIVTSLYHMLHATANKKFKTKRIMELMKTFLIVDILFLIFNPITKITIEFVPRDQEFTQWIYNMHPLYYFHLAYSYLMILCCVSTLLKKIIRSTKYYRTPYVLFLAGLIFIVGANAVFLFSSGDMLDFSILLYTPLLLYCYYILYIFPHQIMMSRFARIMFNDFDQAIVLFDDEDYLFMKNKLAEKYFDILKQSELTISEFCESNKFKELKDGDMFQFLTVEKQSLICSVKFLKDEKQQLIGKMYVFSNASSETDVLTGFHKEEYFLSHCINSDPYANKKCIFGLLDIENLAKINEEKGHTFGDEIIMKLCDKIKDFASRSTYFIRDDEANIIFIDQELDLIEIKKRIIKIRAELDGIVTFRSSLYEKPQGVVTCKAVENVTKTNRNCKLVSQTSARSQMFNTLIKALKESDDTTEAHVKRTQELGKSLGILIGLSDYEQSQLSLLCLLHDIGKIAVPLEILNKPGKLDPDELVIMQSHVEKGYNIAMSSDDIKDLAEMILYHHERWDGKGYPVGISGENIPLLSRMVSIIDSFDAMTNDRCYHKGIPAIDALKEIKRCAGTQFDPKLAKTFIDMMIERLKIEEEI